MELITIFVVNIKTTRQMKTEKSYDILIHLSGTYGRDDRLTRVARTLEGDRLELARSEFFNKTGKAHEDINLELLSDEEQEQFYDIMYDYWTGQCDDQVGQYYADI